MSFRAYPKLYKDCDFWNLKFYERNSTPNGLRLQKVRSDHGGTVEEVPYGRTFSHLSKGRFSLRNKPVSYWARQLTIATCETTELLKRDSNLTFEKMHDSLSGKVDPTPDGYGYPECRHISAEAKILDLTAKDCVFIKAVERLGFYKDGKSFFCDIVRSRDENVYPADLPPSFRPLRD